MAEDTHNGDMGMDLQGIQAALHEAELDGWLFYDFQHRDHLAYRVLGLDADKMTTRRWFYFVPTQGDPIKLCHTVESTRLDSLPGDKRLYLPWQQLHAQLQDILGSAKKIAMQYSENNHIPYVSMVDAGTIELVKSFGHTVRSSADLVQLFESRIDEAGYQSHVAAGKIIQNTKNEAFTEIGNALKEGRAITELEVQQLILKRFAQHGIVNSGDNPIVGVNEHPTDPHFQLTAENSRVIKKGDTLLIDLWGKKKETGSIFYDITWCAYVGDDPPAKYVEMFSVVCAARDAALNLVRDRMADQAACRGWEIDDACRNVVRKAGFGDYFIHRTGHSIGEEVHGNGVHIDNLETRDERKIMPGICFSIEPGIYIPNEMAVRSEINVFITLDNRVVVSGDIQQTLILI